VLSNNLWNLVDVGGILILAEFGKISVLIEFGRFLGRKVDISVNLKLVDFSGFSRF